MNFKRIENNKLVFMIKTSRSLLKIEFIQLKYVIMKIEIEKMFLKNVYIFI